METKVEVDKVRNNDLFVRMDGGGNFGPHSQVCPHQICRIAFTTSST